MDRNNLVTEMVSAQKKYGLSDRAFARRLGISHSYWISLRQGKKGPGRKFVVGVMNAFPFLETEAIECLKGM